MFGLRKDYIYKLPAELIKAQRDKESRG